MTGWFCEAKPSRVPPQGIPRSGIGVRIMKIGLVGLKQTGKTTVFELLTGKSAAHSLGGVNTGIGFVPDKRVDFLSDFYKPKKTTFAQIEFTDIVGFSAAWDGQKSAAAKFLNDVRHCDALVYVLRSFESPSLPPEQGAINPAEELDSLETELMLADLVMIERRQERIKTGKKITKENEWELDLLGRCYAILDGGGSIKDMELSDAEQTTLSHFAFLTAKPRLAVVNQDENQFIEKNYPHKEKLEVICETAGIPLISLCAAMELEISLLPDEDKQLFIDDLGLSESGISVLARTAYELLGLISFFTVGEDEVKAWTVTKGIFAKAAAGKIHTDIERGFIRAEVVKYNDFNELGSMAKIREKGLLRIEGKEYTVTDGDIINYRFNV